MANLFVYPGPPVPVIRVGEPARLWMLWLAFCSGAAVGGVAVAIWMGR